MIFIPKYSIIILTSAIAVLSFTDNFSLNKVLDLCPYGSKYSIDCVDCFCNPVTGTTECSDEECVNLENKCPNGTKFTIGCGNVCHCNKDSGNTICMVLRCRKKYTRYLGQTTKLGAAGSHSTTNYAKKPIYSFGNENET